MLKDTKKIIEILSNSLDEVNAYICTYNYYNDI